MKMEGNPLKPGAGWLFFCALFYKHGCVSPLRPRAAGPHNCSKLFNRWHSVFFYTPWNGESWERRTELSHPLSFDYRHRLKKPALYQKINELHNNQLKKVLITENMPDRNVFKATRPLPCSLKGQKIRMSVDCLSSKEPELYNSTMFLK